jgi:hypothetical protein
MKYLLIVASILVAALAPLTLAQGKIDLQPDDTIRTVLEKHVGQSVDLRLRSGEKLGGKLEKVTDKLVHLSQLSGAEYFDGVIGLEDIAAVAVRTKAK